MLKETMWELVVGRVVAGRVIELWLVLRAALQDDAVQDLGEVAEAGGTAGAARAGEPVPRDTTSVGKCYGPRGL